MTSNTPNSEAGPTTVPAPFAQIHALCESFRREWVADAPGMLGDYLNRLSEEVRSTLFQNLLPVEIAQRQAAGQQPNVDEYLQQFPDHAPTMGL